MPNFLPLQNMRRIEFSLPTNTPSLLNYGILALAIEEKHQPYNPQPPNKNLIYYGYCIDCKHINKNDKEIVQAQNPNNSMTSL